MTCCFCIRSPYPSNRSGPRGDSEGALARQGAEQGHRLRKDLAPHPGLHRCRPPEPDERGRHHHGAPRPKGDLQGGGESLRQLAGLQGGHTWSCLPAHRPQLRVLLARRLGVVAVARAACGRVSTHSSTIFAAAERGVLRRWQTRLSASWRAPRRAVP